MEIFSQIKPIKGIALALGFFDGIHIGHRKIFSTLVNYAREKDLKTGVITFSKNPADYFSKTPTLAIQSFKDKELILENLGIDYLFELDFEEYKEMEAEYYLKNILIKNFNPSAIIVGYNHTFGKERKGNSAFLKEYEELYGYECIIVPEQKYKDCDEISSSVIRKNIEYGNLETARELLGRYFSVRNSVIKGDGRAKALGYPTANLIWPNSMVKLPYGVYFGFAHFNNKMIPSLISWGNKPTFTKGDEEILEAHLYDFDENLYGKILNIYFIKKLRDVQKFSNPLFLKGQIQKDYEVFEGWAKTV